MNGEVLVAVVRYSTGARLTIRSWLNESLTPRLLMIFETHQAALTLVESDRWAQISVHDISKYAAKGR